MLKFTYIIPDENRVKLPFYNGIIENSEPSNKIVKDFILNYDKQVIKDLKDSSIIDWFIETVKSGHLIIQSDNEITFYLPPVVTRQQYQYIIENKHSFYGYDISIISVYSKDNKYYTTDFQSHSSSKDNVQILMDECRKKYISNNNSYVMVIPNENDLVIDNGYFIKEFDSNILAGHGEIFKLFCMLNFVSVSIPDSGGYYWGKELAAKGFFSTQKEDSEFYLFIPSKLSDNQLNWFKENREYLLDFEFLEAGIWLDENNYKEIFKYEDNGNMKTNEELVAEIYETVELIKNRGRCI